MSNTTVTTMYIVRHGQSMGNANFITTGTYLQEGIHGELQSPLSETGKAQVKMLAAKLADIHFDAIFSSDLNRTRETAELLAQDRNLPVTTQSRIRERSWGKVYANKTVEQRRELIKVLNDLNEEEKLLYKFSSDGESAYEAANRFIQFLKEIAPSYQGKTILVVNHGNNMRSFLVYLKFAKFDELPGNSIENTGYIKLETDGNDFVVKETYKVNKQIL